MKGLLTVKDKIQIVETSEDMEYLLSKQSENLFFFHTHNGLTSKCNTSIPSINDIILTHTRIKKYHFILLDSSVIVLEKLPGELPLDLSSYTRFLMDNCNAVTLDFKKLQTVLESINTSIFIFPTRR